MVVTVVGVADFVIDSDEVSGVFVNTQTIAGPVWPVPGVGTVSVKLVPVPDATVPPVAELVHE